MEYSQICAAEQQENHWDRYGTLIMAVRARELVWLLIVCTLQTPDIFLAALTGARHNGFAKALQSSTEIGCLLSCMAC